MRLTADELHRRGVDLSIRGRFALAESTLERAAARGPDLDLAARIDGTRAIVLQNTGRPGPAEVLCRAALARPGLRRHTRAVLTGQLGALALMRGRLPEAERLLSDAIAALDDDPVARARVRVNRSVERLQRRQLDDAAADLDRAAETFAREGLTVDEGQAEHNRAYVALMQGDIVAALRGMQQARPLAGSSPVARGVCDADQAEVLRDAGLVDDAERMLARAAAMFGAHRMPQARAQAEFQLACSLLLHDPPRARRVAAAAAGRFRALGNATWTARAQAVRMRADLAGGAVRIGGGRLPDSRTVPTPADVRTTASDLEHRGLPDEAAALRLTFASWLARHDRPDAVGPVHVAPHASLQVQLLAHETRALRALARGRLAPARRSADEGLGVLARRTRAFGSLDLQTSIAVHANGLLLAGLESALRSRRPDVVFEWSERARMLTQRVAPLRPPTDPELAADLAELRMLRADDPGWATRPRAVELRERARTRQWGATGAAHATARITLDELMSSLDPDTALVSYVYSGDALTALVATRDACELVPLPEAEAARGALPGLRADLDVAASVRTGPLVAVVTRSLHERLEVLSAALLDRPLRVAGDRRLAVTIPGILAGIPWGMLPHLRERAFTLPVSASHWYARRRIPAVARTAGFVVGPGVSRGDEEVETAASAWSGARLVRGAAATADAVTGLAGEHDVLHLVAHGRHAADNPFFSGLELADGALFGYDLDRIGRVPATVVLSACESGRSSVRWGEEAIGMARLWLHAGARAVVATPVVVADDTACELLGAMHAGLAVGESPSEALANACARTGLTAPFQVHGAGF